MGFLTTRSWREWCDAAFWCDEGPQGNMGFWAGDVVFCKIDEVLSFFEHLRLTRKRIILVTGEGDLPCDGFRQRFLPANVAHWFATNVTSPHPRVTAMPLGLGSPRSGATLREEEISVVRAAGIPRNRWLYVNFRPDTHPAIRQPAYDYFRNHRGAGDWITFHPPSERGSNGAFLDALVRHRFVVCPPGNGVDTHRMWESLLAGAVPVVLRSQAMEPFSKLPLLFVDDFREVTLEFLEAAFHNYQAEPAIHPLMTSDFWNAKIREAAAELEENPMMGWHEWTGDALAYGVGMMKRRLKREP